MFRFLFTEDVKTACASYFDLCGAEISDYNVIESFLIERFESRDIEAAYNLGLITKDEVCSFVISNLYSKFIMKTKHNAEPSKLELDHSKLALSEALFKLNGSDQGVRDIEN